MLTIRPEQMAVFRDDGIRRFEDTMLRHVAAHYPDEADALGGPDAILDMIRRTITYGRTLGFTIERDFAALIDLTVAYGEPFDQRIGDPDISEVLHDQEISPRTRVELIVEMLPED